MRQSGIADQADDSAVSEMARFVFTESQGIDTAFMVWLSWISHVCSNLPLYHRLRGLFEPVQSPGVAPLFVSCVFGLPSLLDKTLESMPNIDLEVKSKTGHTCIYLACYYGHAILVSRLIEANANPTTSCGSFGSPMHAACFRGHEEVVRTLLRHGISAQSSGTFGSPFEAACRGGHEKIAALLVIEQAAAQTVDDYAVVLQESTKAGFRDLVKRLTQPTTQNPFGPGNPDVDSERQSIIAAIREGRSNILQSMLRSEPHLKDKLPDNCMAIAAHSGQVNMVAYLHGLGMNIEAEDSFGSPLRCASLIGSERIIHLLLEWGANPNARGTKGDALQAAAQNGHTKVMKMLVTEGAEDSHDALQSSCLSRT